MKYFFLFLIACALLLGLFLFVNRLVLTKLKKENEFRKMWEKHVCEDVNWTEGSDSEEN
jgi:hypothetical protein